jgi:hypothetical protein
MADDAGKTPRHWAADLTRLLNAIPGIERFPVDVENFAPAYSRQRWPDDPVLRVEADDLRGFEGALVPMGRPRKGWGILLNAGVSDGRRRFTAAHEFGHYLLHRHLIPADGLYCDEAAMRGEGRNIEKEADQFAAALLMPLDDMRLRIGAREKPTLDMLSGCADRYGVSLTAVTLRWLEYTERRAIVVASTDGFALWARSSEAAFRSGRFIRTSREPYEIPNVSCAGAGDYSEVAREGVRHPPGVWFPEAVEEISIFSENYDQTFTVLHLDDAGRGYRLVEEHVDDTFDRFAR